MELTRKLSKSGHCRVCWQLSKSSASIRTDHLCACFFKCNLLKVCICVISYLIEAGQQMWHTELGPRPTFQKRKWNLERRGCCMFVFSTWTYEVELSWEDRIWKDKDWCKMFSPWCTGSNYRWRDLDLECLEARSLAGGGWWQSWQPPGFPAEKGQLRTWQGTLQGWARFT